MVIQNVSSDEKTTDITFTIKRNDLMKTLQILQENKKLNIKILHKMIKYLKYQS